MHEPTQQEVITAIDRGMRNAQEYYSKGATSLICWCYEYLITANIYQTLTELPALEDALTLEDKVEDILNYRRERRGSIPERCTGDARCDLTIWHTNRGEPRIIVEVKRWAQDCKNEVDRLSTLLNRVPCLESCFIVSCLFEKEINGSTENKIKDNINTVYGTILDKTEKNGLGVRKASTPFPFQTVQIFSDEKHMVLEKWVWSPVYFIIYRKRKK